MSAQPVTVIGAYLSPYVRKVLVCLDLKGIAYRIDPIVPFFGNDAFTALSPVRRVPVLIDGETVLPDSSVICAYLDERYPGTPLLPEDPAARARARWLEEYADTRMGEVIVWRLFNEVAINPYVWGKPTDEAVLARAVNEELPELLDYLEGQAPVSGYFFGAFGLADIAVASLFRNAEFARYAIDAGRWPRMAALVAAALAEPAFAALRPFEKICLRTPVLEQRAALGAAGAPLSETTWGTATPREGILSR